MKPSARLARDVLGGRMLFHFTSLDLERLAQVVHDSKIYFSRPAEFNDPFEVSPYVDMEVLDFDDVRQRWIEAYVQAVTNTQGAAALAMIQPQVDAARADAAAAKHLLGALPKSLKSTLQSKYRVYCLSTQLGSVQMWSHYGIKHRGLALEFNSLGAFFGDAYAVNYVEAATPIDPEATDGVDLFVHGLLTKSEPWRSEDEYRLIGSDEDVEGFIRTVGGLAPFPAGELTGIYVGCNMPDPSVRAVVNEAARRRDPLPVRQMVKVPHRLALTTRYVSP
jgi:hypothetical protein